MRKQSKKTKVTIFKSLYALFFVLYVFIGVYCGFFLGLTEFFNAVKETPVHEFRLLISFWHMLVTPIGSLFAFLFTMSAVVSCLTSLKFTEVFSDWGAETGFDYIFEKQLDKDFDEESKNA